MKGMKSNIKKNIKPSLSNTKKSKSPPLLSGKIADIEQVSQGIKIEDQKNQSLLNFVNGGPQKTVYADFTDEQFETKLSLASFEDLMRMAVKMNVVPCGDLRRLKQLISAKRNKIKEQEGRRTDKIMPKSGDKK